MTASTRTRVIATALFLVFAAAMQPAAQAPAVTRRDDALRAARSPREVFASSVSLAIDVVGRAVPTAAETRDGYVGVEDVVPGDAPGEWVATTPHAAHWFDARWQQVGVTDLGRRYRRVHPVRFARGGPVALVAEEGNVDRLIEFDRTGRETGRVELRAAHPPVFGDLDGDGVAEIAVASKKRVEVRRRDGSLWRTIPLGAFVTDLDLVTWPESGVTGLLAYQSLSPRAATRFEVVTAAADHLAAWTEDGAARYSVVEWPSGPVLVAHEYRSLRIRNPAGRLIETRDSGYDLRTRYARGVKLGSGHEVLLCYNRHFGTSVLLVYDAHGARVHAEHPGGFTSTLWARPDEPDAFYMVIGADIVRYRLRP